MTEIITTQVVVNLREGIFSLSGSESFVEKYMPELKEFIEKNITLSRHSAIQQAPQNCNKITPPVASQVNVQKEYDKYEENGIYYRDEETGNIQILKTVPGKSKASKSKNVALILLYAKNDVISSSEIIAHCTEQACFDQPNFSATFKKKDGCFIRQGNGQNWTLKLTIPGKEKAIELMESMIDVK